MSDAVTAAAICDLLHERARGNNQVFFREVTDYGRSVLGHQSRIDAIAMQIGYAKYQIYGYEIKVSRQDFVHDEKWHQYLEMCNNLYFVCPHGLIGKDEVPSEAGLMYVSKNGTKVRIVKKAPYRTVEYSPKYFMGMIFNKLGLGDDPDSREARLERAARLCALQDDAVAVGLKLGSALAATLHRQALEQERLQSELERLREVRDYLTEKGVMTHGRALHRYEKTPLEQLKRMEAMVVRTSGLDVLAADAERICTNLTRFVDRIRSASERILREVNEESEEESCHEHQRVERNGR